MIFIDGFRGEYYNILLIKVYNFVNNIFEINVNR